MSLTSVVSEEALIDLKCAKTYILNLWYWYHSFYKLFDLDAESKSDLFFVVSAYDGFFLCQHMCQLS